MLPHSIDRSPVAAALSWGTSTVQGGGGGGSSTVPHTHETAFCGIMILDLNVDTALREISIPARFVCQSELQHSNIFEVFAHTLCGGAASNDL